MTEKKAFRHTSPFRWVKMRFSLLQENAIKKKWSLKKEKKKKDDSKDEGNKTFFIFFYLHFLRLHYHIA